MTAWPSCVTRHRRERGTFATSPRRWRRLTRRDTLDRREHAHGTVGDSVAGGGGARPLILAHGRLVVFPRTATALGQPMCVSLEAVGQLEDERLEVLEEDAVRPQEIVIGCSSTASATPWRRTSVVTRRAIVATSRAISRGVGGGAGTKRSAPLASRMNTPSRASERDSP